MNIHYLWMVSHLVWVFSNLGHPKLLAERLVNVLRIIADGRLVSQHNSCQPPL